MEQKQIVSVYGVREWDNTEQAVFYALPVSITLPVQPKPHNQIAETTLIQNHIKVTRVVVLGSRENGYQSYEADPALYFTDDIIYKEGFIDE